MNARIFKKIKSPHRIPNFFACPIITRLNVVGKFNRDTDCGGNNISW